MLPDTPGEIVKDVWMSLRAVFLLCFAAACLPAVGWSGWTAWRAWSAWSDATEAVRAATAMGDALHLVDALSVERSALQERALTGNGEAGDTALLARDNDALLARAQESLRQAGLPEEAVVTAREMLTVARTRVAESVQLPLPQRDPNLVTLFMAQLYGRLDAVAAATALAERGAARANAGVGALVAVGSLSVEMRAIAGRRSGLLGGWLRGHTPTPTELDDAMVMTGEIQHAWDELQRQVLVVGAPPRLVTALATLRDGFFREGEPQYRNLLAIARAGGERPMSLVSFRRWTIGQLNSTLVVRDAAIAEAVAYGRALAVAAETQLLVAGAATIGVLMLAGGALLVLLRRLILPVQRLTAAVTRLAGGDVVACIPERDRTDEIGFMAAAIEICRQNAVQLQQTNLRFDAALGNMSQGLTMWDGDERLVVANARFLEMIGLTPEDLPLGITYREALEIRMAAGHFAGHSGEDIYDQRVASRRSAVQEAAFQEPHGQKFLEVRSRPMPGGGWLSTMEDVTERRRAEIALREANELLEQRVADALARHRDIEEALRQSQKMEAVGQLTGGLAHDFNNMLASIAGSLEILQARIAQGRLQNLERYIVMAQGAAKRAAALTHRLLAFSRRQTLDPRPTDVNRLVAEMEDMLSRTVGPEISIEVIGAEGLWSTLIDPNQLENALLNLCLNARDAMPDGGRLTIETENCHSDAMALRDEDLPPGQYVSLRVRDTGSGMSAEIVSRAFDPFFTTKPIGMGTGLGLSMIYGFVRQSGGRVSITSRIGRGTQVSLHLPRHEGAADVARPLAEATRPAPAKRIETILVVDDEPTLRMLVAEVLEDRGYAAIACSDGTAGLKVLESGRRIDLLITDVGLPGGMNGRQLADAARRTRADLKVLFITGYAERAAVESGQLESGMQVMTKPFPMDVLAKRVTAIIASE